MPTELRPVSIEAMARRLRQMPLSIRDAISPAIEYETEKGGAFTSEATDVIYIGPQSVTGIGPFSIVLGPAATIKSLEDYELYAEVQLPPQLKELLCSFNGAVFYEMTIHSAHREINSSPSPFTMRHLPFSDFAFNFSISNNGERGINGNPEIASRRSSLDDWIRYFIMESGQISGWDTQTQAASAVWSDVANWLYSEVTAAQVFRPVWKDAWLKADIPPVRRRRKKEA